MFSVGLDGAKKDPRQAVELFSRACRGGDRQGCVRAASVLVNPDNPAHDYEQAFRLAVEGQNFQFAAGSLQSVADDCVSQIEKITEARQRESSIDTCFKRFDDHFGIVVSIHDPDEVLEARQSLIEGVLARCEIFRVLEMAPKRLPKSCEGVAKSKTVP